MPFYDKIQDVVYETENYEFLGVTKETYIEDDRSRLTEDNATTANFLGLIPLPGWQAFMDAALNFALSTSENRYRYTLGDIERESYTVSYKKREQYTYTDAYGIRLVLKIDYTIKEVFRIGAGKKNKCSYFDSKEISSNVFDYSYELWENGKKVN